MDSRNLAAISIRLKIILELDVIISQKYTTDNKVSKFTICNLGLNDRSSYLAKSVNGMPKLYQKVFQVYYSDIRNNEWRDDTINVMLQKWLSYLK